MLRELSARLWVAEQPHRYLGFQIGVRTTVIRLHDGSLFVHSPIRLLPELRADLDRLGPVKFVIAPDRFHHLSVGEYQAAYPEAQFYCAPGLEKKRPALRFNAVLEDRSPAEWEGQIDQVVFRGFSPLNEVVFFHRDSRTAIFTDLIFNVTRSESGLARMVLKLDGAFDGPAVPRSFRWMLKRHRDEIRSQLARVLQWDFDRVTVTHGDVIETGGKALVSAAWAFL